MMLANKKMFTFFLHGASLASFVQLIMGIIGQQNPINSSSAPNYGVMSTHSYVNKNKFMTKLTQHFST